MPPGGDFWRLPLAGWQGVFDLNLVGGALLPCQVFGETMVAAGRGSIINIASMAAILPLSRVVAYSAAKAAVLNLTQFLAREWATKGVRVNAISPGFFPAEQNRAMLLKPDGGYTERGGQIIGHTPMARFGEAHAARGRRHLAGFAAGIVLCHRPEHRRGWRLFLGDDLVCLDCATFFLAPACRREGRESAAPSKDERPLFPALPLVLAWRCGLAALTSGFLC